MFGGLPLVIDPNANETERVLDELVAVMRKYGYVLAYDQNAMLLAKISDGVGFESIVVAQIRQINPTHSDWRPITGKKSETRTQ